MEWKRKEKGGRGVLGQNGAPERSEDLRHIISKTETPRSDIIPNYLIKTYPPIDTLIEGTIGLPLVHQQKGIGNICVLGMYGSATMAS